MFLNIRTQFTETEMTGVFANIQKLYYFPGIPVNLPLALFL